MKGKRVREAKKKLDCGDGNLVDGSNNWYFVIFILSPFNELCRSINHHLTNLWTNWRSSQQKSFQYFIKLFLLNNISFCEERLPSFSRFLIYSRFDSLSVHTTFENRPWIKYYQINLFSWPCSWVNQLSILLLHSIYFLLLFEMWGLIWLLGCKKSVEDLISTLIL